MKRVVPRKPVTEPDSIDMLRRDHSSLASTVSSLVQSLSGLELRLGMLEKLIIEIQTDREVRKERDRNQLDRLVRIETSIEVLDRSVNKELEIIRGEAKKGQDQIVNLGKYILAAIFVLVLGSGYSFLTSGALSVSPG